MPESVQDGRSRDEQWVFDPAPPDGVTVCLCEPLGRHLLKAVTG